MQQPKWVDEYIESVHNAFVGMVPSRWGSLNFFEVLPYINGTLIDKVSEAVKRLKAKNVPIEMIAKTFSCPSTVRSSLYFLAEEYRCSKNKRKAEFREIAEMMATILEWWTPEDTFARIMNRAHRTDEISRILNDTSWAEANTDSARELGRLYNSAAAVVFSLYRDFFPQDSHEVYGPYDASAKFGEGAILLIKDFPKLKPVELWPNAKDFKHSRVTIYQVYKNVEFKCDWIGMHSLYTGNLITGLVAYAVEIDGISITDIDQVKAVRMELERAALDQSKVYDSMSHDDWLKKILEWDCYQFYKLFALAGMDWRPTEQMLTNVKGANASMGFSLESFPAIEEYKTNPDFDAYWLIDLYK